MLISIDEKAAFWFKKEFAYTDSIWIRMFPQYAGFGAQNKGYSLAFSAETPANAGYSKEVNGITFFIEGNDVWFFEETETHLSINEYLDELHVTYKEVSLSPVN